MSAPIDESQAKIEKGLLAESLLGSSAINEAVLSLRNAYIDNWIKAETIDAREECHQGIVALSRLLQDLKSTITTGTLTRQRIDALQGKRPQTWMERLNG